MKERSWAWPVERRPGPHIEIIRVLLTPHGS